jgi:ferritin-like metal-binding protein YciE
LWIERTLVFEVLPRVRLALDSEWLADPVEMHLEQTREHVRRVESVFLSLGVEPSANASAALQALQREHDELVGKAVEPRLRDLLLASALTKSEHLELAVYDSLLSLADTVGVDPDPLERNRREDEHALDEVERAARRLRERLPTVAGARERA